MKRILSTDLVEKISHIKKNLTYLIVFFFFCIASIPMEITFAQHQHDKSSVGKIDFKISGTPSTQEQFNHALAMLHHMMYDHAKKEFTQLSKTDPNCAMAYWGIAMSYFHPLWHEPTKEDLSKGWEAIEKAKSLNPSSQREKDYISAIAAFYKNWEIVDHKTRLNNWEAEQKKLYNTYPDDIDAGAFYALSHLTLAPKDDKTFSYQKEAGSLLEELHKKAPEHPGLFHYIIHSYDNPVLAPKAVEVARAYDKLAPDVPHALHMPSHIFVRLGLWSDAIEWNIRSAASALKNSLGNVVSTHYPHALDYLMYSYLQQAQDKLAGDVLKRLNEVENYEDLLSSVFGVAAGQARYLLERRKWSEAESLPVRFPKNIKWDKYPYCESMTHFARGVGAARNGNIAAANNAIEKLNTLYNLTKEIGQDYWAVLVDVQRITVSAWVAFSEGKKDEGLKLMRKAADLEDSVDKHPVTPGAVLPARELLGDMLILSEKPVDALYAYEIVLKTAPNRFNSLYGAGHSAELSGNLEKAKHYYSSLEQFTNNGDGERSELKQMKIFLAGN